MNSAYSQGATPFVEIEAWQAGSSWSGVPSFSAIAGNGDASDTNCSLDQSTYTTSCATWLADLGKAIASYGHPVVLTFAHEFNVGGQYPWAAGYIACEKSNPTQCPPPASCGTTDCTPSQWIAAWDGRSKAIIDAQRGRQRLLDVGAQRGYRRHTGYRWHDRPVALLARRVPRG